jgi:proteasome assembly chaperone (PAC2) family protein
MITFDVRPELSRPVLICAFRGWNDGGEAATSALLYLRDRWGAERFAHIDPEEFFDFQLTRPTVKLVNGTTRQVDWPSNEFFFARLGRDVILLAGTEPNLRWRTFTEGIVSKAQGLGAEMLISLGGFLADVPHSRPVPVTGSASDERRRTVLGLERSRYQGPTGIVGVLHDAAARAGLDSISLWAAVPHYAAGGSNPKAALALLEKLSVLLEVPIETASLAEAAVDWEARVSAVVAENPELLSYVERLEEAFSQSEDFGEIPSGEELVAELERFLREQRDQA